MTEQRIMSTSYTFTLGSRRKAKRGVSVPAKAAGYTVGQVFQQGDQRIRITRVEEPDHVWGVVEEA